MYCNTSIASYIIALANCPISNLATYIAITLTMQLYIYTHMHVAVYVYVHVARTLYMSYYVHRYRK